ncbi:MAG: hypothetical protein NZ602_15960 [Thermoguttaceae bacterium]|nr:hypothetical protein [Thermoguttaceae bacterium]MDW8036825.1 hypothetical protein [Thermoguttaceae bacterium]
MNLLEEADGQFLENLLQRQLENPIIYPVDPEWYRKITAHRVRGVAEDVTVTVPEEIPEQEEAAEPSDLREWIQIQTHLVQIGNKMGMQEWVPPRDRSRVLEHLAGESPPLLERLPLNYNEATLKTIEQIDVLWQKAGPSDGPSKWGTLRPSIQGGRLRGKTAKQPRIEVGHSTSIDSGLLRMADLLALQPNMYGYSASYCGARFSAGKGISRASPSGLFATGARPTFGKLYLFIV